MTPEPTYESLLHEIEALKMELEFAARRTKKAEDQLKESRAEHLKLFEERESMRLRLEFLGRAFGVVWHDLHHEVHAAFKALKWKGGAGFVSFCGQLRRLAEGKQ